MGGLRCAFLFPIITIIVSVGTIVTTLTIAKTTPNYSIGGIPYPYISDTGRDPPAYYVFVAGMSLSAVFFLFDGVENFLRIRAASEFFITDKNQRARNNKIAIAGLVFIVLGAIFLSLLAGLDTRNFPDMHNYAAYVFFVSAVIFISLTTANFATLASMSPIYSTPYRIRLGIVCCFVVFFVCYIIVGLALVYTVCGGWVIDSRTGLYDYSSCAGIHTFRAITQYLSILSIIAFLGSLAYDFRKPFPGSDVDKGYPSANYPL